ncbi:hypothetical protein L1987_11534 [Smallanthus sonchifolius]|uniref:Uncharacterized protein n=1 Tax=Smallanthus sonchifolius TaxID=185202 RepID=A0ACB9JDD6_9ASTR|nr:hypothetical protein L1987_11534 [Smallanthus sonchifolius]
MAKTSRTSEDLLIPRKSWTRNHKTGNGGLIINNNSDRSPVSAAVPVLVPIRKVPVLYYLSRNGHLEHPHLIDVPLSSPHGLYLRDVMNTLNCHRGRGTANMYSWSFKRSYKNGYVWHDVSEEDLIQPSNSHDYVLKGSELHQNQPETYLTGGSCTSTTAAEAMIIRRNQSWSSFDNPHEYLVSKCESNRELAAKFAPDAVTQTEEQMLPGHVTVEVSTEDMPSSPPSNSSSEVVQAVNGWSGGDRTVQDEHGRMKVSRVLIHMITCGVDSVRNVSPVKNKQDQGCTVSVERSKGKA